MEALSLITGREAEYRGTVPSRWASVVWEVLDTSGCFYFPSEIRGKIIT